MPIFRFLSLGNETPNLVFETQKRLVFLGLNAYEIPKKAFSRKHSSCLQGDFFIISKG